MSTDVSSAIQNAAFFRGLSKDACRRLAGLCRREPFAKRDLLFLEQTRGDKIYYLESGQVQLSKTDEDGSEIVIKTVRPGEVFGEVILLEQDRYPVTAAALTSVQVLVFLKQDMLRLLDNPDFRNDFIAMLMRKQRYLAERVRYLTSYDVEQRFFLFLEEQYGDTDTIAIDLSKKDIAASIGATPETLSRLILRLTNEGKIAWTGKKLKVKRRE